MPLTKEEFTVAMNRLWDKISHHMYIVLVIEAIAALIIGYLVGRLGH